MPRSAFYALFIASGFAGLIYESVWTHYLKLFLGHAAYAQSLVLAVFMGGMAAGAADCARRSAKLANPLAAYAVVEAIIGLAALAFHPIFVALTDWSHDALLPRLGNEWLALAAKLGVSCVLILPQSVLLGMTFPLMSAGLVRAHPAAAGESVAMLYFTNSLGAVGGVLASGFFLIAWSACPARCAWPGCSISLLAAVVWLLAGSSAPCLRGKNLERGRANAAARRRVLHRCRVLHLRDRLDPHAVARAGRVDALVRAHARRVHPRPRPRRIRRAPARGPRRGSGLAPRVGADRHGACRPRHAAGLRPHLRRSWSG